MPPVPSSPQAVAAGEIRGQIIFPSSVLANASLTGLTATAASGVSTSSSGTGLLVHSATQPVAGSLMYVAFLDTSAFNTSLVACHVHGPAAIGVNAGVLKVRPC